MSLNIEITLAKSQDAPVLASIMIDAWQSAFRGILPDEIIDQYTQPEACTNMFTQILTSGAGTMYLASASSQPMGLIYMVYTPNGSAQIEALLTIPEAWGQGIGAALITKAIEEARLSGCPSICVWPFADNRRARRFYAKWGFIPTGNTRQSDALEVEYLRSL